VYWRWARTTSCSRREVHITSWHSTFYAIGRLAVSLRAVRFHHKLLGLQLDATHMRLPR
jgi:hypothetical protein